MALIFFCPMALQAGKVISVSRCKYVSTWYSRVQSCQNYYIHLSSTNFRSWKNIIYMPTVLRLHSDTCMHLWRVKFIVYRSLYLHTSL
jgi:hypothetical protein